MIHKLRKRFIIAAMCAIVIVLEGIMILINGVNCYKTITSEEEMIDMIESGDKRLGLIDDMGPMPKPGMEVDNSPNMSDPDQSIKQYGKPDPFGRKELSPEIAFQTRFFIVETDEDNIITSINIDKIAAIDSDLAADYAQKILSGNRTKGYIDDYRYRVIHEEAKTEIVFLECRRDIETLINFAFISFGMSFIGLLAVFILVLIFSKIVFKPVEESYQKQKSMEIKLY